MGVTAFIDSAEGLDGPADETQLRSLLDALTQSPTDMLKGQLDQIIASGDFDTAVTLLQQAVNEEPNNQGFRVELADVLVRKGGLDDARRAAYVVGDHGERSGAAGLQGCSPEQAPEDQTGDPPVGASARTAPGRHRDGFP